MPIFEKVSRTTFKLVCDSFKKWRTILKGADCLSHNESTFFFKIIEIFKQYPTKKQHTVNQKIQLFFQLNLSVNISK